MQAEILSFAEKESTDWKNIFEILEKVGIKYKKRRIISSFI